MRILINCIAFHTAGTRTVGINLISSLKKVDRLNEYFVIAPAGAGYENLKGSNVKIITFRRMPFYYLWRIWFDQIYLSMISKKLGIDVFLNLNNLPTKFVATPQILMLQQPHLLASDSYRKPIKDRILFWVSELLFRFGISSVSYFIVQTPIMAEGLISKYMIPENKIKVIKSGYEHYSKESLPENDRIRSLFNDSYINVLCVSRYYPHKNLEVFLGVGELIKKRGLPIKIFLTIDKNQHHGAKDMLSKIEKLGLGEVIINLGYLDKAEVATAYKNATVFVLPTLLESFGLVYLEAMKFEIPIATSDRDFARYICNNAALYFNPKSADTILDAILKIAYDKSLSNELIVRGKKRLVNFFKNWDEVAVDYLNLINICGRK